MNKKICLIIILFLQLGCGSSLKQYRNKIQEAKSLNELISICEYIDKNNFSNNSFFEEIVNKAESFKVKDEIKITKLATILNSPVYQNVIIVPDLSNRLININNQSQSDITIIKALHKSFYENIIKVNNPDLKDIFMIDIVEEFQTINTKPITFTYKEIFSNEEFNSNESKLSYYLKTLYSSAIESKIIGNDFTNYFQNYLNDSKIQKTTFEEIWHNKIVILTDGYLETATQINYTPLNQNPLANPIRNIGKQFTNTSVFICEVHMREGDKSKQNILKQYWHNWFQLMNINNIENNWWQLKDNNNNVNNSMNELNKFIEMKFIQSENKNEKVEIVILSEKINLQTNSTPTIEKELTKETTTESNIAKPIPKEIPGILEEPQPKPIIRKESKIETAKSQTRTTKANLKQNKTLITNGKKGPKWVED
jgi:hypothetical protein